MNMRPSLLKLSLVLLLLAFSTVARAGEPDLRLITAHGEGKIEIPPDAARIHVGVEAEDATLANARKNNEKALRKVLQQVTQLKLPGLLMKSDSADVSLIKEERDRPHGKLAPIIGYRVYTSITIRVNDNTPASLSQKASRIVDAALAGGATQLHGVTFLRLDSRGAYNQALRAAIDDAKLNAAMMAGQAKVNLFRLRTLTPGWGSHYPELSFGGDRWGGGQHYTQAAHVGSGGGGTVVAAGSFLVKASVTAVFEIK
jgi:uncharacterized protein